MVTTPESLKEVCKSLTNEDLVERLVHWGGRLALCRSYDSIKPSVAKAIVKEEILKRMAPTTGSMKPEEQASKVTSCMVKADPLPLAPFPNKVHSLDRWSVERGRKKGYCK